LAKVLQYKRRLGYRSTYYCGVGGGLRKIYNGSQHVTKSAKNNVLAMTAVNLRLHGCKGSDFSKAPFSIIVPRKMHSNDPNLS
jgi:hypothetical protein